MFFITVLYCHTKMFSRIVSLNQTILSVCVVTITRNVVKLKRNVHFLCNESNVQISVDVGRSVHHHTIQIN